MISTTALKIMPSQRTITCLDLPKTSRVGHVDLSRILSFLEKKEKTTTITASSHPLNLKFLSHCKTRKQTENHLRIS